MFVSFEFISLSLLPIIGATSFCQTVLHIRAYNSSVFILLYFVKITGNDNDELMMNSRLARHGNIT